jgi:predicted ATPase
MHGEEFLTLSSENDFPFYLGWARAFQGQALTTVGQAEEGLAQLRQGLAEVRATVGAVSMPMLLTFLAEAYAAVGQRGEEQNCLAEAARIIETTDERVSEPELLHRVPGDLLNAAGDLSGAEQHYRQAIAVAERQSAKFFQLRASTSLARLWRDQGKRREARDLLCPIYNWFTEGFDAADLKDAKALLEQLTP